MWSSCHGRIQRSLSTGAMRGPVSFGSPSSVPGRGPITRDEPPRDWCSAWMAGLHRGFTTRSGRMSLVVGGTSQRRASSSRPSRAGGNARSLLRRCAEHVVGRMVESLESRQLLAATTPIISEFMADNGNTLADQDGAFSDWIEIHNPTPNTVNLDGYYLT